MFRSLALYVCIAGQKRRRMDQVLATSNWVNSSPLQRVLGASQRGRDTATSRREGWKLSPSQTKLLTLLARSDWQQMMHDDCWLLCHGLHYKMFLLITLLAVCVHVFRPCIARFRAPYVNTLAYKTCVSSSRDGHVAGVCWSVIIKAAVSSRPAGRFLV